MMEDEKDRLFGDKKIPTGVLLKRILKYIGPELKWFILAFLIICINVALDIYLPQLIQNFVALFKQDVSAFTEKLLLASFSFAGGYLILGIINQIFLYAQNMILTKGGQRVVYSLRMEVFEHIENMSQNQFNDMPVGSLVTRVANYTSSMSDLFTSILVNILKNIFMVVGVYVVLLITSWKLALVLLIFIAIVFVTSYFFKQTASRMFREERKNISDLNTFLSENLSGMKITQIFNQEKRKENEFLEKNETLRKSRYRVTFAFALFRPFISFLYYAAIATIFFAGLKINLNAPEIVAFYLYLSMFFNPIQNLADQLSNLQKATTSSERLFNLLDVEPQILDKKDAIDIDHFEGKIEFKNVWFAYEKDNWILKDVSFTIEPKQTVAFVGATGAGKTTILSLIVRNFEIQKGQILIDGIDITKIKVKSLRKAVGQMLQDVFLFSGTIKSNITLHDDSFSNEEIKEACKYVNASTFIDKLPKGLEEPVIERGENFSSGQRQLLSFARTVLHKPQILILDEATANIDTETEVLIQDSLEKMKNIGTMLVVAHRLSTIQHADNIICLQHGEILEQGNHQSLLKQKGYYYKLYKLQFENRD